MPPPRSDWPSWIPCTILSFQPKLPAACWISPAVLTPWRYTSAALHPCGAVISTRDWGCHHPFAREKDWDFTFALQDVLCAPPAEAGDLALIFSFCPCWAGAGRFCHGTLQSLNTPRMAVSFPTRSLGGRGKAWRRTTPHGSRAACPPSLRLRIKDHRNRTYILDKKNG